MTKTRSAEVLSLDTTKQKQVVEETKQIKKKIKDGTVTVQELKKAQKITEEQRRGLLFISHLPHGFYEEELKKYFQQFGKVTNVIVCRSGKTGNSKGYGYVEFSNPDVAKIAAETMNNYLMFKKRITASFVPFEKRPKGLFKGKVNTSTRFSSQVRREKQYRANLKLDSKTHLKRTTARLSNLNKKLARLQDMGIKTTYTPIDIIHIKQEQSIGDVVSSVPDSYDSDIKVQLTQKKSKPSVKSAKSVPAIRSGKIINSKKSSKDLSKIKFSSEAIDSLVSQEGNVTSSRVNNKKETRKKKNKTTRSITKKSKMPEPLNTETVKKIARELIRKRGDSLITQPAKLTGKTKSPKKKVTSK